MFLGKGLLLGRVPKQGMFPGGDRRLYGAPPLQRLKRRGRPASAHCQVCLKTGNSNSKRTVQIFIYTRALAIWSWSYTHFWDTGFAHSLYIAVNKVCDSVVTYNCKLILEVLLSSTNNTWLAKVSKLWIVRSSGIFGDYIHNSCSLLHLSYPPAARCVQLFTELHNTTQGLL